MIHGESRDIKHNIINGPYFFHPGSAMLHREFTESEHRRNRSPLMRDHDPVNVSIVANAAPYGGLPIHRIILLSFNPCKVRVL